jgi:prepilin-type N-terminal cleavage/methylation domain-containing protein
VKKEEWVRYGRGKISKAFTLLELVLVLAIISLTILAAAPALQQFTHGQSVGNTAAQFISTTQFARSQAVSDGTTYRLNIDANAGRWWLTMDDGNNFVAVDASYGANFTVPTDVRIESSIPVVDGSQVIEFDPSGRSDAASVRFLGNNNNTIEVVCETPMDLFHVAEAK